MLKYISSYVCISFDNLIAKNYVKLNKLNHDDETLLMN